MDGKYLSETIELLQNDTINRQTARLLLSEMLQSASESPSKVFANITKKNVIINVYFLL